MQGIVTEVVDNFALLVENVVILKKAFANGVILLLHPLLGILDDPAWQGDFSLADRLFKEFAHNPGVAEEPQ